MSRSYHNFLSALTAQPVESLHGKGFAYFHHAVMPRLLEAGKNKEFDRKLLSDSWQLVGDIYRLNGAPLKAQKVYQKALAVAPDRVGLLYQMALVLIQTGNYHKAYQTINQALEIDPDNFRLITERQRIQDDINYDSEPHYRNEDPVWNLNELLAEEQFEKVVNAVLDTEMDQVPFLKCITRAYGAVSHHANYLQVWQRIIKLDKETEPEAADWFYLPVELKNDAFLKTVFVKE